MKYNVGDKVIVRSDLSADIGASAKMVKEFAGKVVTISAVEPEVLLFGKMPNSYQIEEDTAPALVKYLWHDDMFAGLAEETKETPEVKEDKPSNAMPEITTGMFGRETDGDLFVVIDGNVIYQMGLCDSVEYLVKNDKIANLYDAMCFKEIEDGNATVIWSANGETETPKDFKEDDITEEEEEAARAFLDFLMKLGKAVEDDGK